MDTVLKLVCFLFWLAAATIGILFPDRDWRIPFIIASITISAIMGIFACADLRKRSCHGKEENA